MLVVVLISMIVVTIGMAMVATGSLTNKPTVEQTPKEITYLLVLMSPLPSSSSSSCLLLRAVVIVAVAPTNNSTDNPTNGQCHCHNCRCECNCGTGRQTDKYLIDKRTNTPTNKTSDQGLDRKNTKNEQTNNVSK